MLREFIQTAVSFVPLSIKRGRLLQALKDTLIRFQAHFHKHVWAASLGRPYVLPTTWTEPKTIFIHQNPPKYLVA